MRRVLLLVLLAAAASPATAQFTLSGEPYVGQELMVTLPAGEDGAVPDTLLVTYRPNAAIARRVVLPTGGASTVSWTPDAAGVVALTVPGGVPQNISVRYQRLPPAGLVVLFGAGFILFGGALFAFRKLFEDDGPRADPERRPDT